MSAPPSQEPPCIVNVIGSGVLGLTCALELAKQPGSPYRVNVVTAESALTAWSQDPSTKLPVEPDFASPWAGAFWHPFTPQPETELQKRVAGWETKSFKHLWEIAEQDPSVVMKADFKKYYDHRLTELPWYMDLCPEARKMNDEELAKAPEGKVDGIICKSVSLNPIRYLDYLRKQLVKYEVQIIHHRLETVSEAFLGDPKFGIPAAKIVVNASGLGAGSLCGVSDELMEPIRGQTILIRPPQPIQLITRDDDKCIYICSRPPTIPGEGEEVILGGSYEPGNSSLSIDNGIADRILTEALKLRPDLSRDGTSNGIEILDHIAALRPSRKDGPRVERENFTISKKGETQDETGLLVHCYGIGGGGFQASYGAAAEVRSLIETQKNIS
ncbi:hypothetical protein, variant [Puccinia triticina 1-1 BBBD Race 1]|uniref:DAO domain-containing protein n=2 Tax=Puccinia triticina TaxID=208348 RepID=A0A0C4EK58_PUCT1|nr:uncharacterized protein PtA15_10A568 [Puccinia triticina]OAV97685.1 hypothetical protein PTTG_01131 [Puccinia triticina 1-1 BBBD Race 1]ALM22239.1 D-amino acid oxidase [Puccinia triticina]OAV97686.1 hypothetical protein, variant [Puccinia triticina 1-1 BBBD Race 1]WAQ89144.1 hypothetical protein PtA15_10A568 [Puccinia triticina]WAR59199.1 hypothetical protein PtB15_10B541 [Puccinia triticina]